MLPIPQFLEQPLKFWADIRTISQGIGYTVRGANKIKIPTANQVAGYYGRLNLTSDHLVSGDRWVGMGELAEEYFRSRARLIEDDIRPRLMDAEQAKKLFLKQKNLLRPRREPPMNKQKGEMRQVAYLTALVNMCIEAHIGDHPCDYDPQSLTTITRDGQPLRTLARRLDGAFPSTVNPIAVWETKEYYYTTTFGSRIADGVYETLLDGMEINELRRNEGIDVSNFLMIDGYRTWWQDGKSFLCRLVDMLHMGYVSEILVGREVISRLPELVAEWKNIQDTRAGS